MKQFKGLIITASMVSAAICGYSWADNTTPLLPQASSSANTVPAQKIDLHKDWFNVKYDDVRENTILKTKDSFGPGSPLQDSDNDAIKISFSATFPGKTFDPNSPITVTLSFNRMAGMLAKQDNDMIFGTKAQDDWKPVRGNKVLIWEGCTDVLLVLPSGVKVQEKPASISYTNSNSEGFMGEKYQWETITITGGIELLNQLQDGGKMAICDSSMVFQKDNISQARSLLSSLNDLAGKSAGK